MECDRDSDMPIERKPPLISISDVDLQEELSLSKQNDSSYSRYRNDPSQSLFDNSDSPSAIHNNEPGDLSGGAWSGNHSQQAYNLNQKNKFAKKKKKQQLNMEESKIERDLRI